MKELKSPSIEEMDNLVSRKENFIVIGIAGELQHYCELLEKCIEGRKMSCRVRTKNRTAITLASAAASSGLGLLAFLAQAGHNLVTFNPDWEIIRNIVDNKIEVVYCPGIFS